MKKNDWVKMFPLVRNPQFLSNQADFQGILPTHELVTLTNFRKDLLKIVDFLITGKF